LKNHAILIAAKIGYFAFLPKLSEMLPRILYLLLGCLLCNACVLKPSYDQALSVSDSLRYELAREKKQRIQLQEYETELYYRYVEKNPRYVNQPITPRKHIEDELIIPRLNSPAKPQPKTEPKTNTKPEESVKTPASEISNKPPDLNELIAFPNMRVRNSGTSRIISFPEGAFFEAGSTQLNAKAQKYLADFAKDMAGREDYMIDIEGHTDNTEQSKEPGIADRWDLSAIRATRVLRELVKLGVSPYRVVASARGQFKPRVPNEPAKNKIQNRRIEIRITPLRPDQ